MIMTLRESKARLSELVERAASGEEVLITVRGRPKARLVPAMHSGMVEGGMADWANRLRGLQKKYGAMPTSDRSVVEELRDERW
jgi:prevent-host-death family protein